MQPRSDDLNCFVFPLGPAGRWQGVRAFSDWQAPGRSASIFKLSPALVVCLQIRLRRMCGGYGGLPGVSPGCVSCGAKFWVPLWFACRSGTGCPWCLMLTADFHAFCMLQRMTGVIFGRCGCISLEAGVVVLMLVLSPVQVANAN